MIGSIPKALMGIILALFVVSAAALPKPGTTNYADIPVPTGVAPYFGYPHVNPDRKVKQVSYTGYVEGATAAELFPLVNDWSENSVFWKKTLKFKQSTFDSAGPNGIGSVRRFGYHPKPNAEYTEMLQHSDPEKKFLVYCMHECKTPALRSMVTYVIMTDEPENNRCKVTWFSLIQFIPFPPLEAYAAHRQLNAYRLNVETLNEAYAELKK